MSDYHAREHFDGAAHLRTILPPWPNQWPTGSSGSSNQAHHRNNNCLHHRHQNDAAMDLSNMVVTCTRGATEAHRRDFDCYDDESDDLTLYLGVENVSNMTRRDVLTSYRDMSRVSCNDLAICVIDPAAKHRFPVLLHHVLFRSDNDDSIEWLPHGRAFVITDRSRFCANVCPLIVNSDRYEVFIERIEEYGFQQTVLLRQGDGHGAEPLAAFFHERFLWSRWWLAYSMNSRRDDDNDDGDDRAAVPTDQVRFAFRSLQYFPALEYETDLSSSTMVALNASLLIANRLPIGDKSPTANRSITP